MPARRKTITAEAAALLAAQTRADVLTDKVRKLEGELKAARRLAQELADSRERAMAPRSRVKLSAPRRARSPRDRVRLIFGDMHGAQMEPQVVASIVEDIRRLGPDEIVLLGDMVNCGGFLAQHHTLGYVAEIQETSYEGDIAATNEVLDAIIKAAPRATIHYLEGNHEARVEKWCVTETLSNQRDAEFLRRAFSPEHLLRLRDRGIHYYRRSEFYHGLPVPGTIKLDKCFFWHGTSAARHAAARNAAQVGGNIVFGHVHRMQQDQTRPVATGEIAGWCPGCSCKLAPLWQHGRPSDWTHGEAVQLITAGGKFLHLNVPIIGGESLLLPLFNQL
jgi:hypothetical protein